MKLSRKITGLVLVIFLFGTHLSPGQSKSTGLELLSDSTLSGYKDDSGFGGPKTIGAQLETNDQKSDYFFWIPIGIFKPWYEVKRNINEKIGFQ